MKGFRSCAVVAVLGVLAACAAEPPLSNPPTNLGGGVGFGDYATYMRAQEELSRLRAAQARETAAHAQGAGTSVASAAPLEQGTAQAAEQTPASIGAQAVAAVRGGETAPGTAAAGPVSTMQQAQPAATQTTSQAPLSAFDPAPGSAQGPAATQAAAPRTSDTVSNQTFEPRPFGLPHQNRVVRRDHVPQVQVNAVTNTDVPNLFAYALSTRHNVGEPQYRRTHPLRWRRHEAACAAYRTPDLAQEAFLSAGGPVDDPQHLDPDGDGFACGWDPAMFRIAAQAARQ